MTAKNDRLNCWLALCSRLPWFDGVWYPQGVYFRSLVIGFSLLQRRFCFIVEHQAIAHITSYLRPPVRLEQHPGPKTGLTSSCSLPSPCHATTDQRNTTWPSQVSSDLVRPSPRRELKLKRVPCRPHPPGRKPGPDGDVQVCGRNVNRMRPLPLSCLSCVRGPRRAGMGTVIDPRKSRQPRARFVGVARRGQDLAGELFIISCDGRAREKGWPETGEWHSARCRAVSHPYPYGNDELASMACQRNKPAAHHPVTSTPGGWRWPRAQNSRRHETNMA